MRANVASPSRYLSALTSATSVERTTLTARFIRALPFLVPMLSLILTLLVYGRALSFSYFLDDAFDLTRTQEHTYWSLLTQPLPGYVYYRPIPFMLWKAIYDATGSYNLFLLHLLPVAAHALSGWLLFLLLRRITRSWWSIVPMVLFLVYPFSYQALLILGTLVHTLVTVLILAALLLWYDGRTQASPPRLAASAVIAVLALWTHEYGTIIVPLLAGMEGLLWWQRRVSRPTLWILGLLAAELLYLRLWFSMDKPDYDRITGTDVLYNVVFLVQGFSYPVTRQAVWLIDLFGGGPIRVSFGLGLLGIAVVLFVYLAGRQARLPLVALAWGGIAFLPAVATLTNEYVLNGPRLLYIVAPGSAVFWGLLPMIRFPSKRLTLLWRAGTLALLLVVAVQCMLFIERRTVMLEHGTDMARGVIAQSEKHAGGSVLLINVPAWFAPKTQEFPQGHLGVQLEPDYIGLERLIYAGSGERVQVESRSLAPKVSEWHYYFQPHGAAINHDEIDTRLRAGATLIVVDLLGDRIIVREPGLIVRNQLAPREYTAILGDALRLVDADVGRHDGLLAITTRWFTDRSLSGDYQIWIQIRSPDGRVHFEMKDYAMGGMSPPRLWQSGELIEDRRLIDLPAADGNELEVWLALVNTADASLLPVTLANGRSTADNWMKIGTTP